MTGPSPSEVKYVDQGKALALTADLVTGWRRLQKTYGFFSSKKIYFKRGWSIRTQLTLIAQPATFDARVASSPDVFVAKEDATAAFTLHDRRLDVKVPLRADQPWRMMSTGRPGLFIEELGFAEIDDRLWLDLRAWIVFHHPPASPVRDVREWCERLFVPGGQIESNRGRH